MTTVLSIGATGSIGRLVVDELLAHGASVRALVRDEARARTILPDAVALVSGDLASGEGLVAALAGVDGIVLTHGGDDRTVDYDGVLRVLKALDGATPRIALMTSMGVTRETSSWGGIMNWKRRAERLVRAYGAPYTIVRPGWFEYQSATQNAVLFEQGDGTEVTNRRGVARSQIAKTLVEALFSPGAEGKTIELFAQEGDLQGDFEPLFAALLPDDEAGLAGGGDHGVGLEDEPQEVRDDVEAVRGLRKV
ncbi:SDR family oxidoreductase [Demequina sp.]|uniref:SDR family oxidoreductase n=1 Tax=Demequina sp. TaxID=2050685 RepID=UPI003D0DFE88